MAKIDFKDIYSKAFGIDERTFFMAAGYRAVLKYAMIGYAFANNAIDVLFLNSTGFSHLPQIYILSPMVIMLFSLLFSLFTSRIEKRRILNILLAISGALYILFWAFPKSGLLYFFAFLYKDVFLAVFLILYYTIINEGMDSKERKKVIPFILAGAAAAVGFTSFFIAFVSRYFKFVKLVYYLPIASIFNLVAIYYHRTLPKRNVRSFLKNDLFEKVMPKKVKTELKEIFSIRSKYLMWFTVSIALSVFFMVLVDYNFRKNLSEIGLKAEDMSVWFGMLNGIINTSISLFQNFLFSRLIPFIGTINIFIIFPAAMTLASIFIIPINSFYGTLGVKMGADIFKKLFEEPGVQFGYNPFPLFYKGKIISFVEGVLRPGSMILAGTVLLWIRGIPLRALTIITAASAFLYFVASLFLRKEYFKAFYKKIKTENELLSNKIESDEFSYTAVTPFPDGVALAEKDPEFRIYRLIKNREKLPPEELVPFVTVQSIRNPESLSAYLAEIYTEAEALEYSASCGLLFRSELVLALLSKNKITPAAVDKLPGMEEVLRRMTIDRAKVLYGKVSGEKIKVSSLNEVIAAVMERPYTAPFIEYDTSKAEYSAKAAEDLIFLIRAYKLFELNALLYSHYEEMSDDLKYQVLNLSTFGERMRLRINAAYSVIEKEIRELWLFLLLYKEVLGHQQFDPFYYDYMHEKCLNMIQTALCYFMDEEDFGLWKELNLKTPYITSEILLYYEEKIQKTRGVKSAVLAEVFEIADIIIGKRSIKKIKRREPLEVASNESSVINYITGKYGFLKSYEDRFIKKENEFMDRMVQNLILLKGVDIFSGIPVSKLEVIAMMAKEKQYKKDDLIIKEGQQGEKIFIVKNGSVEVFRRSGMINSPIKRLYPGGWFGELSILSEGETLASVKALEESVMLEIPKDLFRIFILNNPDISFKIFEILVSYIKGGNAEGETI